MRRDEPATLTFKHLQTRDGRWVLVDLMGNGRRVRTVPGWPSEPVTTAYVGPLGWDLALHDLHRTVAKLARSDQAPLEQLVWVNN